MISQFYLGDNEIVHLILSLQDTNNWSLRHLQLFLKTIFQTLCANLSVWNSYDDHYSLLSSSYYLHNELSQSLFLNARISVGYQIYYIRRRTGPQSRLRVFKGVKADSLFLEEYFLSKQNVKHPYLISLEFRSSLQIMPMPSMGFNSSRNKKKKKQMMLQ